MRSSAGVFLGVISGLAACSGPAGASASVKGNIGGATVPTTDVIGMSSTFGSGPAAITSLSVVLTSQVGLCGRADAAIGALTVLRIGVSVAGSSAPASTYTIGGGSALVTADYDVADSGGTATGQPDTATAGSITFTSVSSSTLAGSFEFTFPDGQVSGTFNAPICKG
jgi:hypothetical protein